MNKDAWMSLLLLQCKRVCNSNLCRGLYFPETCLMQPASQVFFTAQIELIYKANASQRTKRNQHFLVGVLTTVSFLKEKLVKFLPYNGINPKRKKSKLINTKILI